MLKSMIRGQAGDCTGYGTGTGYLVLNLCTAHVASCSNMLLDQNKQGRKRGHMSKSNKQIWAEHKIQTFKKVQECFNFLCIPLASLCQGLVVFCASSQQRQTKTTAVLEALTSREALHSLRGWLSVSQFIRSISEKL